MDIQQERAHFKNIKLVECPRDAMQGWKAFIPTEKKIEYLNALLKVGFDTLDFGSFVSPKAIPQMADTAQVIPQLDISGSQTRLLAIVANTRGAEEAIEFEKIHFLGYPFSVSETFQMRNANSTIIDSLRRVEEIQRLCLGSKKELVIYISMGFGNPYGDAYSEEIVFQWVKRLVEMEIRIISLADTVGLAQADQIYRMTSYLIHSFPEIETGVHLHSRPEGWKLKVDSALNAGCSRFDGALKGIGGCPMADDELVGNMNSEFLIPYFRKLNRLPDINEDALLHCMDLASTIFQN